MENEDGSIQNAYQFDWKDYSVFMVLLLLPLPLGMYYTSIEKSPFDITRHFIGRKSMKAIPIGLSLTISFITSMTLVGIPLDVYLNGSLVWMTVPTLIAASLTVYYLFLPVFYELNVTSAYHYIELRFNRAIRLTVSCIYLIANILILPMLIYGPALILSDVSGLNVPVIAIAMIVASVLYTNAGLEPVTWIGAYHFILIIIIAVITTILSTNPAGGVSFIFKTAYADGKLTPSIDPNPFQQNTLWTALFGGFFIWTSNLVSNQISVQRFISVGYLKQGKFLLITFCLSVTVFTTLCFYLGLILYAGFYGCDPIEQEFVSSPYSLLPYFAIEKLSNYPAVVGLIMSGLIGASISLYSNSVDSLTFTLFDDFLKSRRNTENNGNYISTWITIIIGIYTFLTATLGNPETILTMIPLMNIALTATSLVFIMGIMIPITNSKGVLSGIVANVMFLLVIFIGNTVINDYEPISVYPDKSYNCSADRSMIEARTNYSKMFAEENDGLMLLKLSPMLHLPFGWLIGVVVGSIVSWTTREDLKELNHHLISPPIRRFLPKRPESITITKEMYQMIPLNSN